MVSALISRVIMLTFGTLYPAYCSYKAIKNKDVREYVKWMMYWIIFALFITAETFADTFLSWLPLYYEIKIVFIIWLLSPATKGSSILYRKFVHPRLVKHEKAIDKYIAKAQTRSYATLMDVGKKGLNVATDTLIKTAATGQYQLVQTIKRYNSMQELAAVPNDNVDAGPYQQKRSTWYEGMSSSDRTTSFDPENDVDVLQRQYKEVRTDSIEEETYQRGEMQRSQSDVHITHERSPSLQPTYDSEPEEPVSTRTHLSPQDIDEIPMSSTQTVNYSYAYTSNTLPRARKSKKPIHETLPATSTTRPRRKRVDKNTVL